MAWLVLAIWATIRLMRLVLIRNLACLTVGVAAFVASHWLWHHSLPTLREVAPAVVCSLLGLGTFEFWLRYIR
jgi:hypothetical protein